MGQRIPVSGGLAEEGGADGRPIFIGEVGFLVPGGAGIPQAGAGLPIARAKGDLIVTAEVGAHDLGGIREVFAVGITAADGRIEAEGVFPGCLGNLERAEGAASVTIDGTGAAGGFDMVNGGDEILEGFGFFGRGLNVCCKGLSR